MASTREIRTLVCAAAAAAITVTGAVVVIAHADGDGTRKITGTVDAAPGLGWSLDAASIAGQDSGVFRNPRFGSEYDSGTPGFIDNGDVLAVMVALSDDGMTLHDAQMVGVDADTGQVRWESPADGLSGCAHEAVDGMLVCFTPSWADDPALLGYDLATGEVTRTPTEWGIFAIGGAHGRLYVAEGDVESDDVRLHAGTVTEPDAHFTQAFEMGTVWEDMYMFDPMDLTHGQGVLTLSGDLAGFDLDTGRETWAAEVAGCSHSAATRGALVLRHHVECDGYRITGSDVLDRGGDVLAVTDRAITHSLVIDDPADETIPVLLGDGGVDRRTGERLWSSPDLMSSPREADSYNANTHLGTAVAILGDVALLRDHGAHTTTGLDLRTGTRLWQHVSDRFGAVEDWDGHVVVQSDSTGLWALDVRTGDTVWDIPFLAVDDDPDALDGVGQFRAHGDERYLYTSNRTMIDLRPLPRVAGLSRRGTRRG
jgi:outer membrane protein assembly factor BamB